MDFAILFKDIRRKENLTQVEFAKKLNVSRSAIAQIESSKNNPSRDLMLNILEKFDLPDSLKKKLEKAAGVADGGNTEIRSVLFNFDELDGYKKNAYFIWIKLSENRQTLLSLCFSLKELDGYNFSDEQIDELTKIDNVIDYLFKVLMPFQASNYINIKEELLLKANTVLDNSHKMIFDYSLKLSKLYTNKLRVFEDLNEYRDYQDISDDYPF